MRPCVTLEYPVLIGQTRGSETSRIEAFSDGVFAFALTLLVVSLEVPGTFAELMDTMRGFPAFAASFAILTWIWFEHYRFFRRYRLVDAWIITLNSLLLFVVLFYIYPLKFMFSFLARLFFGLGPANQPAGFGISVTDSGQLLAIYGIGFVAVFAVLALMHWRVIISAPLLDLDAPTRRMAWFTMRAHLVTVSIGLLSLLLVAVLPLRLIGIAGFTYALLGPVHGFHAWYSARQERAAAGVDRISDAHEQTEAGPDDEHGEPDELARRTRRT
jgi:uncharacterized membrane protein